MADAIRSGRLEDLLVFADVATGDVLYIPANTIHALGPGLLIYEIQQSSDTTYRLYDWERLSLDGVPRPLHVDKGLEVANLQSQPRVEHPADDLLVDGEYFCAWRHRLQSEPMRIGTDNRFQALSCIEGTVCIEAELNDTVMLATGESGLIPACIETFSLRGVGTVLRSIEKTPHSSAQ